MNHEEINKMNIKFKYPSLLLIHNYFKLIFYQGGKIICMYP